MRVETKPVGGRLVGLNEIPARVWIDSYDQLWDRLGVATDVRWFTEHLASAVQRAPAVAAWMRNKPLDVLTHTGIWPELVDTVRWIEAHGSAERHLR